LRSWARTHGYDVGDRGRISQDVRDAFLAANGKGAATATAAPTGAAKAPAKKAVRPAAKKAAAKKPAAKKAAAKKSVAKKSAPKATTTSTPTTSAPAAPTTEVKAPATRPSFAPLPARATSAPVGATKPVASSDTSDGAQLKALLDKVSALESRVAGLERAPKAAKKGLFGRRS
jgi:hypothetical protein